MGRIRSIKPEFSTDGTNLTLSDSCALFFILLWTHCDDEGKHRIDLNQVVAELGGRWHKGKVKLFISCLVKTGQLRIDSTATWMQVTGWSHQKIDKPKQPDVKASDLQWLSEEDSTIALEQSRPFDARIGSDRIDRTGSDHSRKKKNRRMEASPPAPTSSDAQSSAEPSKSSFLIARYCEAWKAKYRSNPDITGKDAGIAKRLARSLTQERISTLIDAYFALPDAWLLQQKHPLELFESKLKAIAAFADSGNFVTRRQVAQADDFATNALLLERVKRGEL